MERTNLEEQKRLMGLAPRYPYKVNKRPLKEADDKPSVGGPEVKDPRHPDSPEDDQDLMATPKPDNSEPPNTTGAGASKYWDMYRGLEEKAMKLHNSCAEMYEKLSQVTESEMDREQRRTLKSAQMAVREAMMAQKEAFRKISEFGSTMLGR